jgi:hypothetical protein
LPDPAGASAKAMTRPISAHLLSDPRDAHGLLGQHGSHMVELGAREARLASEICSVALGLRVLEARGYGSRAVQLGTRRALLVVRFGGITHSAGKPRSADFIVVSDTSRSVAAPWQSSC